MPCDAVATASARVNLDLPENLSNLVSPKEMATIVETVLTKKYDDSLVSVYPGLNGAKDIRVWTEYVSCLISIDRYGQIKVTASSTVQSEDRVTELADEMTTLVQGYIKKVAGVVLQKKVKDSVKKFARITEESNVKGAKVLRFEF